MVQKKLFLLVIFPCERWDGNKFETKKTSEKSNWKIKYYILQQLSIVNSQTLTTVAHMGWSLHHSIDSKSGTHKIKGNFSSNAGTNIRISFSYPSPSLPKSCFLISHATSGIFLNSNITLAPTTLREYSLHEHAHKIHQFNHVRAR